MLSVVIPTKNSEEGLARTLSSLVAAAAEGVVREVVVVDHASGDGTRVVADAAGCTLVEGPADWEGCVALGLAAARRGPWVLVLPPNVFLDGDWVRETASFVERVERSGRAEGTTGVFRLAWDEFGWRARIAEGLAGLALLLLGRPRREQGLLVARAALDRALKSGRPLAAAFGRTGRHVLRADAVILPPSGGGSAVPSVSALVAMALAALGLAIFEPRD